MAELLDIVDLQGNPTGRICDRETVHSLGLPHRTSHVWILRRRTSGIQILLQKRSACKDSHPGCYDISSAGHIPAGSGFIESALRELSEELGLSGISPEALIFCGQRYIVYDGTFHGQPFHDRQVSNIYCLWLDVEAEDLILQESELESVLWMNLSHCRELIRSGDPSFPHCIYPEELDMLPQK